MIVKKNFLRLFMLSVSGLLILCIPFYSDTGTGYTNLIYESDWLIPTVTCFAFCAAVSELMIRNYHLTIGLPDILITLIAIVLLFNHPFVRLIHYQIITYLCLWFCLRSCLSKGTSLSFLFMVIIMVTGTVGASFALLVKSIAYPSRHILFESGVPYSNALSGYIISAFPLSLWIIYKFRKCNKLLLSHRCTQVYYLSYLTAGISFIAILSNGISGIWLLAFLCCQWIVWRAVFKREISNDQYLLCRYLVAGLTFILFFCSGLFFFGKNRLVEHNLLNVTMVICLILFFSFLGSIIYTGIRKRRYGVVMAILSLLLVTIPSSYIDKPHFIVLLTFLSAISISSPYRPEPIAGHIKRRLFMPGMICFIILFLLLQFYRNQYRDDTGPGDEKQEIIARYQLRTKHN